MIYKLASRVQNRDLFVISLETILRIDLSLGEHLLQGTKAMKDAETCKQ